LTHTPGPWVVAPDPGRDCEECGACHEERFLVGWEMRGGGVVGLATILVDDHEEANARLIAAAPDLLAALEECAERLHAYADYGESVKDEALYDMARKVIRKAKGES
jgi:hypothetical protein